MWLAYQYFSFRSSHLFLNESKSFIVQVLEFISGFVRQNNEWTWLVIIIASLILLMYLVLPSFFQGGLIQIIARKRNGQDIRIRDGVGFCFKSFLPVFGYHLITNTFSLLSVFSVAALLLRVTEFETFKLFLIPLILVVIFDIIVAVLFTYSHLFIIIDEEEIIASMMKSSSLVMMHWQHTLLIFLLMFVIGIRILINVLIVLAIPILVFFLAGLFATFSGTQLGIILGGGIGVIAFFFAAYFSAIIQVFASAVWTFTFLQLSEHEITSAREQAA